MRELHLAACFLVDIDHVSAITGYVFSMLSWLDWIDWIGLDGGCYRGRH